MNWEASNLPEAWKRFQQHVDLIFKGPLSEKDEKIHVTYLLLWVGEKGRDIYNTWSDLSDDESESLSAYYGRYKKHCQPKSNPIFARYKLDKEKQGGRTVEQWVTKLKVMVGDCNYSDPDEMVRDKIVFGTDSLRVQGKLINQSDSLTLEKAIEIAQGHEYSQQQLRTMNASHKPEINAVQKHRAHNSRRRSRQAQYRNQRPGSPNKREFRNKTKYQPSRSQRHEKCPRCNFDHDDTARCPAKGKQCDSCHKWNHFASVCKTVNEVSTTLPEPHYSDRNYNSNDFESDSDFSDFHIDVIDSKNTLNSDQAFVTCNIGPEQTPVRFKLDTGS